MKIISRLSKLDSNSISDNVTLDLNAALLNCCRKERMLGCMFSSKLFSSLSHLSNISEAVVKCKPSNVPIICCHEHLRLSVVLWLTVVFS